MLIKVVFVRGFSSLALGQKMITLGCQKSILLKRSAVYPVALFQTSFTFLKNLTADARIRSYIRQSIRTLQHYSLYASDFCTWSCQNRRISWAIANNFWQIKDLSGMLFMPEIPVTYFWYPTCSEKKTVSISGAWRVLKNENFFNAFILNQPLPLQWLALRFRLGRNLIKSWMDA